MTSEQLTSIHVLYKFLRKLRVIGVVHTTTQQVRITEMGRPIRYKLSFHHYDGDMKGRLTAEEQLDSLLEAMTFLDNCTRQSE